MRLVVTRVHEDLTAPVTNEPPAVTLLTSLISPLADYHTVTVYPHSLTV